MKTVKTRGHVWCVVRVSDAHDDRGEELYTIFYEENLARRYIENLIGDLGYQGVRWQGNVAKMLEGERPYHEIRDEYFALRKMKVTVRLER